MIGKSIVEGFRFAFSFKRILPYMALNFLLIFVVCDMLGRVGSLLTLSNDAIQSIAPFFGFYIFSFVLYLVLQPLFLGALLHQAKQFPKEKPIGDSFKFSFSVYLKTVVVFLILFCMFVLIGYVPYLWILFDPLFALASFYVFPAAIADNRGIRDSLKKSFEIFKKHSLQTFAVYLLIFLISSILIISSFIPIVFWLAGNMFSLISQGVKNEIALVQSFAQLLVSPTIIPLEIIPAFLLAFSSVMSIGIKARLYFNLKKHRV